MEETWRKGVLKVSHLNLSLVGPFQVLMGGKPLVAFESDKARALLAYLAVEANRPHRREALAGLLWSDTPQRMARTSLRGALANLRQLLNDVFQIAVSPDGRRLLAGNMVDQTVRP